MHFKIETYQKCCTWAEFNCFCKLDTQEVIFHRTQEFFIKGWQLQTFSHIIKQSDIKGYSFESKKIQLTNDCDLRQI